MADQTIRPIETVYHGYRFRSRLEARWAVFFQTLGVPWEYEPEGFVLSTGEWYLPDFRIQLGPGSLWAEVKPRGADAKLFVRFITKSAAGTRGTVLHGIPDPKILESEGRWAQEGDDFHVYGPDLEGFPTEGWGDNYYQFCICRKCDAVGFEFDGRSERIPCGCEVGDRHKDYTFDHPRILRAYAAARAARFEHGESGDIRMTG
jgi:hypothetical protein